MRKSGLLRNYEIINQFYFNLSANIDIQNLHVESLLKNIFLIFLFLYLFGILSKLSMFDYVGDIQMIMILKTSTLAKFNKTLFKI